MALHPRLLVEPALAIPRPAWERRPRVTRRYAVARTFWDITRHPRRFFMSAQYPNRLGPAICWHVYVIIAPFLLYYLATLVVLIHQGYSASMRLVQIAVLIGLRSAKEAVFGVAIVELPMILLLVIADLALWRDRARFRLFAKAALFSTTIFVWGGAAFIAAHFVVMAIIPWRPGEAHTAWPNWLIATLVSWQYLLLLCALARHRFATLLSSGLGVRRFLVADVLLCWALAVYLALFDNLLGWRYVTGQWTKF